VSLVLSRPLSLVSPRAAHWPYGTWRAFCASVGLSRPEDRQDRGRSRLTGLLRTQVMASLARRGTTVMSTVGVFSGRQR